jgi:hypothetical protein
VVRTGLVAALLLAPSLAAAQAAPATPGPVVDLRPARRGIHACRVHPHARVRLVFGEDGHLSDLFEVEGDHRVTLSQFACLRHALDVVRVDNRTGHAVTVTLFDEGWLAREEEARTRRAMRRYRGGYVQTINDAPPPQPGQGRLRVDVRVETSSE